MTQPFYADPRLLPITARQTLFCPVSREKSKQTERHLCRVDLYKASPEGGLHGVAPLGMGTGCGASRAQAKLCAFSNEAVRLSFPAILNAALEAAP
jgi:hypothetical protein